MNCDLDLHRLDNTLNRLQTAIKKVEDQRSWDSVHLIEEALKQVNVNIRQINSRKNKKGNIFFAYICSLPILQLIYFTHKRLNILVIQVLFGDEFMT